jgi:hypothetical protein
MCAAMNVSLAEDYTALTVVVAIFRQDGLSPLKGNGTSARIVPCPKINLAISSTEFCQFTIDES